MMMRIKAAALPDATKDQYTALFGGVMERKN